MKNNFTFAAISAKTGVQSILPLWVSNNIISVVLVFGFVLIWMGNKYGARIVEFMIKAAFSKVLKDHEVITEITENYNIQKSEALALAKKIDEALEAFKSENKKNQAQEQAINKLSQAVTDFSEKMGARIEASEKAADQRHLEFCTQMMQLKNDFQVEVVGYKDEMRSELNTCLKQVLDTSAKVNALSQTVYRGMKGD